MKHFVALILTVSAWPAFATTNLVLLGAPGSGKGTLGQKLAARYRVPHISTGDIVREQIKLGTPLGLRAKQITEQGGLLPDTPESIGPLVEMIREALSKPEAADGFILDGFPRTEFQAHELDRVLRALGRRLDAVVSIQIPHAVVVERLANRLICPQCKRSYNRGTHAPKNPGRCDDCGVELTQRADDMPGVVIERLERFDRANGPIEAYYREQGQLIPVDGEKLDDQTLSPLYERLEHPYPRGYLQQRIPAYLNPETGVRMYNLIEMLKDTGLMKYAVDQFREEIERLNPDYIAAPEARAWPVFGALTYLTGKPGIGIRKAGKIPAAVPRLAESYRTAYSSDTVEMTDDPALAGKTVVLIDDGISSGGTTAATVEMLERAGMNVLRVMSIIRYHYRGPCEAFLEKGLEDKLTTLLT